MTISNKPADVKKNKRRMPESFSWVATLRVITPYLSLILIVLFFVIGTKGKILSARYLVNLFNSAFTVGLGACGVIFVMAQGNIDFSIGGSVCLSCAIAAMAYRINPVLMIPAAILTGVCIGIVNGLVVAKFRVQSFIATLSMSFVLTGLVQALLNGQLGVSFAINKYDTLWLKLPVLFITLVASFILFEYSRFGKNSRAVGSLPEAARQCGVNVVATKQLAYLLTGFLSGVVAIFLLIRTCTASPTTASGFEFDTMTALMIGGFSMRGGWKSRFRSIIVGTLTVSILSVGMALMAIPVIWQQFIRGAIFIISVAISFERKDLHLA